MSAQAGELNDTSGHTKADLDLDAWLLAFHDGPTGSQHLSLGRKGELAPQYHWGITREGPWPPSSSLLFLTHNLRSQDSLGMRTTPATGHMPKRSPAQSSESTKPYNYAWATQGLREGNRKPQSWTNKSVCIVHIWSMANHF